MHWLRRLAFALLPAIAVQEHERQADPARETFASTSLTLGAGGEVSLRYRCLSWSDAGTRRMRQDPQVREQMNQRLPVALQSELSTPVALSLAGVRLEPGVWRIGLAMNEAGAYQLSLLIQQELRVFPVDLSEMKQRFPYLVFNLAPAEEGLLALTFQWGTEYGRVVFEAAR